MTKKISKTNTNNKTTQVRYASLPEMVHHMHGESVRECAYCGRPMTRSDVNDYGSLCERCYLREYYS